MIIHIETQNVFKVLRGNQKKAKLQFSARVQKGRGRGFSVKAPLLSCSLGLLVSVGL